MSQAWADHLDLLIRARTPILWIRSQEEERIANLLGDAAKRLDQRALARWDFISGLKGWPGRDGEAARNPLAALESLSALPAEQPALLVLHDFHRYADDSSICRKLRNLASSLRQRPQTLVITAAEWQLPRELEECITLLDLPLPNQQEIQALLGNIAQASGQAIGADLLELLTHSCSGLSEQRIRQVAARGLASRGQLGSADLDEVLEEKRQAIARSELLEYCPTEATPADIGGLDALKRWLEQRHMAFSDEA
ncbi:MAG: AAA family ATPase, partial [Vulcanococcus sp.]